MQVFNWPQDIGVRYVPKSPPKSIFWTHELKGKELDQAITGVPAINHTIRNKSQYREFVHTYLLLTVPLSDASTSQVNV